MPSTLLKLTCAAVLVASLSGCILYVAPDHRPNSHAHPDEKPAPTADKTKI